VVKPEQQPDPFSYENWWNEETQTYEAPRGWVPQLPKINKWCHYCGMLADTKDHIVPSALLGRGRYPRHDEAGENTVPACRDCNGRKGQLRSDCVCEKCVSAWAKFGPAKIEVAVITLCVEGR
jgi:hypothetical protein